MESLDDIDRRILHVLQCDGRISNVDLAARVNLSPSACLRRVQELERSGVIKGYRASLDLSKVDRGFVAYVTVGLARHTKEAQQAFERAMAGAPQVRACHNVTGAIEYILRVEVADLAAYKQFHTEVLGATPGVNAITSYIVMATTKDERG